MNFSRMMYYDTISLGSFQDEINRFGMVPIWNVKMALSLLKYLTKLSANCLKTLQIIAFYDLVDAIRIWEWLQW